MNIAKEIQKEISRFTLLLVEHSLCDEQNMPSMKERAHSSIVDVTLGGKIKLSAAMRNIAYNDAYNELVETNSFNVKLLDGGLLQMLYRIRSNTELISHRLAFFSSPSHETFQAEPEIYELDSIYADFIKKNIVPFPIRFDFDSDDSKHVEVEHPKSHLTLGQYEACRIPVTSPMGPGTFIKFILRNFYNSAYMKHRDLADHQTIKFDVTISDSERQVDHLFVSSNESAFSKIRRTMSHLRNSNRF